MSAKFPRILHLPWSPGGTNDDKRLKHVHGFIGDRIIITEKLDGSNLCLTRDAVFARSHFSLPIHPSFDMAKKLHGEIKHLIPENISIFGEWMYAVHSIRYSRLLGPYPLFVFGFRMEESGWWSTWEELEELTRRLELNTVPVLFNGIVEDNFYELVEALCHGKSVYGEEEKEGIVIWPFSGMGNDSDFSQDMAKWVRPDHPENPDEHWMYKPVERQGIINVDKSNKR